MIKLGLLILVIYAVIFAIGYLLILGGTKREENYDMKKIKSNYQKKIKKSNKILELYKKINIFLNMG